MKKQMIAAAALTAILALTGCDAGTGSGTAEIGNKGSDSKPAVTKVAETTAETKKAADKETTTAAATEAAKTAAEVNAKSEGTVKLGESLFGGYVTADTAVKSKPDAGSDTLIVVPSDTQIGVHESGKDGWFMTEFQGKTGYIPAGSVKEIQPYDPSLGGDNVNGGSVSGNAKLMTGTHKYAESLGVIPEGTQVMYYELADYSGWCVVNYQDKIGYVESKYISQIEDYDQGNTENPYDEYIGEWQSREQWNGSNFTIKISRDRELMNVEVSSHSAVADYLWNYTCITSEDGTCIICDEGGTLQRTDYSPEGEMQEPVTVYTDGTARFNIKGGTLFWSDEKESTAQQVGFGKVE
ncbi:MAG: hypothetical protein ILP22_09310 [Oscillospiraceae bacterium]|nr:hypothetical protein [Oscillospiraceae bacterium]